MSILSSITKFLLVPLAVAIIIYVIVHFQLLILHKLLRVEHLDHKRRTTMNIITFFSVFFAVLILVIINQYLVG